MNYIEMAEALKEHEDNLPEGLVLEALMQANESMATMYEALRAINDNIKWDNNLDTINLLKKALAKAEGR